MFPIKTIFKVQYNPIILKLLNTCLAKQNPIFKTSFIIKKLVEKKCGDSWICLTAFYFTVYIMTL